MPFINQKNNMLGVAKNNVIKFRVTKEQKQQIQLRAELNGYIYISDYLRDLAINNDFLIKFNQMYNRLMKDETKTRKNT